MFSGFTNTGGNMSEYHITEIGLLPSGTYSAASAVNLQGDVVGWADTVIGGGNAPVEHAFYRKNKTGQMTDLHLLNPKLSEGSGRALDINESGKVVGSAAGLGPLERAFLWDPATGIHDMGALQYEGPVPYSSMAHAINDLDIVVGSSSGPGKPLDGHATYWFGNQMLDVTKPGPKPRPILSWANDINSSGQVAGIGFFDDHSGNVSGFSWVLGRAFIDLNPGGSLDLKAYGINNPGLVV